MVLGLASATMRRMWAVAVTARLVVYGVAWYLIVSVICGHWFGDK